MTDFWARQPPDDAWVLFNIFTAPAGWGTGPTAADQIFISTGVNAGQWLPYILYGTRAQRLASGPYTPANLGLRWFETDTSQLWERTPTNWQCLTDYPSVVTVAAPSGGNDAALFTTLSAIFTKIVLGPGTYRLDTSFEPPNGFTLEGVSRETVILDSHVPLSGISGAIQRNPVYGNILTTLAAANVRGTRVLSTHAAIAPGTTIKLNAPAGQYYGGIYTVITCTGGSDPYTITVDRPIYWTLSSGSNVENVISYPQNITLRNFTMIATVDTSRFIELVGSAYGVVENVKFDTTGLHTGAVALSFDNFGNHNRGEHLEIVGAYDNVNMGIRSEGGGEFVQLLDIVMHCNKSTNAGVVIFIDSNYAPTIDLVNGTGAVGQLVSIGLEGIAGEPTRAACISQVRGSCIDYLIHLTSAENTRIDNCAGIDSVFGLYLDTLCSGTTLTNSQFLRGAYGVETRATSGDLYLDNVLFDGQNTRGINGLAGNFSCNGNNVQILNNSAGYSIVANNGNRICLKNSRIEAPAPSTATPIAQAIGSSVELDNCQVVAVTNGTAGAGVLKVKNTTFTAATHCINMSGGGGAFYNQGGIILLGGGDIAIAGGSYNSKGTIALNGAAAVTYNFPAIIATDIIRTYRQTLAGTPAAYQTVINPGVGIVLTGIALDTSTIALEIAA